MFSAHGDYSITVENNVITLDLKGSFNLEGVQQSCIDTLKVVENENSKYWKLLLILGEETLLVWEALEDVRNFLKLCDEKGCLSYAYLIAIHTHEEIVDKIFQPLNLSYKYFYNKTDALAWLKLDSRIK